MNAVKIGMVTLVMTVILIGSIVIITQMDSEDKRITSSSAFPEDLLGNYQKWCEGNNGVWYDDRRCGFINEDEQRDAYIALEELQKKKMGGKYGEAICTILQIPCPENTEFIGDYSMTTGIVTYNFAGKNIQYHFKIQDQQLEFGGKRLIDGEWQRTGDTIWNFP